jgi:hypothetical protein
VTIEEFINNWWGRPGGAERSNLAPFIYELCEVLDLPRPGHAVAGVLGDYEFDGTLPGGSFRTLKGTGFIDLYRRGHFVLEAKQSQLPAERQADLGLFEPADTAPRAPSGARYDKLMTDARAQAEHYAKNLPGDHPPAPFIIVLDIGRAFEILFDYTGNGRGYGFFPDKQSYRIELPDLARPEIADRLRAIWADPDSINPRFQSADVTRKIAERLAEVSKWLEETQRIKTSGRSDWERSLAIEETALFLMRILFCMFAEDVSTPEAELLPPDSFKAFLERSLHDHDHFETGLSDLWRIMASEHVPNRYALALQAKVRYFNGKLFESTSTYRLGRTAQGELLAAARHSWRKVEPAIFGTLLEQALTKEERAKLGAHYTPRPYVERLVQATIMDVLEAEWAEASHADPLSSGRKRGTKEELAAAKAFHDRLADLRILDPACGTGNFLYVAMESLQHLENKVIEHIQQLGGEALARIGPHQLHGLELNPRAAKIAELVLWIGWLRFRIANDPSDIHDPVLGQTANINFGEHGGFDAVLVRKETGEPDFENPMVPEWPEADFIIGNPPFIGKGSAMRKALGDDYVEALRRAYPIVPTSTDFVMYWWDRAATELVRPGTRLRRFGFVTTNLVRGSLNRKVIERHLTSDRPLSLVLAVPDHPWTKASQDAASVRIAMSVAELGRRKVGVSLAVVREEGLKTDTPTIEFAAQTGVVHADLRTGTDLTHLHRLDANRGLSSNGMMLAGAGFKVPRKVAEHIRSLDGSDAPLRPYVAGSELMQRSKECFVIDLFGYEESEARQLYPRSYTHVLETVKPSREGNRRSYRATRWWEFGENNPLMRKSLEDLTRYIATTETTKHRVFQFLDREILPDHMIIAVSSDEAYILGVLSSAIHIYWTLAISSPLGVATMQQGHRYNKSQIFDTFPFPDPTPAQRAAVSALAEELDATRKVALVEVPGLTMTELYNLRERLRSGVEMPPADQDRATAARAGIVNRLHEQLDAAVAAAYGWRADLSSSEIVARLVALNAERAAEETTGNIRWLRPDYQVPRFRPREVG